MTIDAATPGLLLPTLALIMTAYSNRFLAIATLIRSRYAEYRKEPSPQTLEEIRNLRRRIILLRNVQTIGAFSFFLCVLCIVLIYIEQQLGAILVFTLSLLGMLASLGMFIYETYVSMQALDIHMKDIK